MTGIAVPVVVDTADIVVAVKVGKPAAAAVLEAVRNRSLVFVVEMPEIVHYRIVAVVAGMFVHAGSVVEVADLAWRS